jgi:hypothetical protein
MALLNELYDLSDRPAAGVTMDRTKPVQDGVCVKLPAGKTGPEQIRDQNVVNRRPRDEDFSSPPAKIPACAANASRTRGRSLAVQLRRTLAADAKEDGA